MVEAYGSTTPITSVAAISVPEPRMITVSVWDKGVTVAVEKAIRAAGLGLNPIVDGHHPARPHPAPDRGPPPGPGQARRQVRRAAENRRAQRAP